MNIRYRKLVLGEIIEVNDKYLSTKKDLPDDVVDTLQNTGSAGKEYRAESISYYRRVTLPVPNIPSVRRKFIKRWAK